MRIANRHPDWQDTLEAALPGAGALAALAIMLTILIV
jgi:hypothetical protein